MEAAVEALELDGGRVTGIVAGGEHVPVDAVISSLPLRTIVQLAGDARARRVRGRGYRSAVPRLPHGRRRARPRGAVPGHVDLRARAGGPGARIQSYGAWSPAMLPDPGRACLGLEYFCFAGDELWETADEDLVALATGELEALGLVPAAAVTNGWVVRVPQAYPMYDEDYGERVGVIRGWLEGIANLQQVGRNGLHRYNNSDHSMLTAIRAVENLLDGARHDLWRVNADGVYLEEGEVEEQPYLRAPQTPATVAGV